MLGQALGAHDGGQRARRLTTTPSWPSSSGGDAVELVDGDGTGHHVGDAADVERHGVHQRRGHDAGLAAPRPVDERDRARDGLARGRSRARPARRPRRSPSRTCRPRRSGPGPASRPATSSGSVSGDADATWRTMSVWGRPLRTLSGRRNVTRSRLGLAIETSRNCVSKPAVPEVRGYDAHPQGDAGVGVGPDVGVADGGRRRRRHDPHAGHGAAGDARRRRGAGAQPVRRRRGGAGRGRAAGRRPPSAGGRARCRRCDGRGAPRSPTSTSRWRRRTRRSRRCRSAGRPATPSVRATTRGSSSGSTGARRGRRGRPARADRAARTPRRSRCRGGSIARTAAASSAGATSRARAGSAPITAGTAATQTTPARTANQRHDLRTRCTSPNLPVQGGTPATAAGRGPAADHPVAVAVPYARA